jgi:hypothetical protein
VTHNFEIKVGVPGHDGCQEIQALETIHYHARIQREVDFLQIVLGINRAETKAQTAYQEHS